MTLKHVCAIIKHLFRQLQIGVAGFDQIRCFTWIELQDIDLISYIFMFDSDTEDSQRGISVVLMMPKRWVITESS